MLKGFSKNPFFYFGVMCFVLFGALFFYSDSLAEPNYLKSSDIIFFNSFFKNTDNLANNDLFFSKNRELALETPDLRTIQDNSLYAVSTPTILTTQTLGDIFGGSDQSRKDVTNYTVQVGDRIKDLAERFGISENTIVWANGISRTADLKVGQNLTILPFSGVIHVVKNGDTLEQIAKMYSTKANPVKVEDIVADNGLDNPQNIFIGDTLTVRNATMPQKSAPSYTQIVLPNSSLIYPLLHFRITQGVHYFNAVDIQPFSGCGTPVYASAAGTVQRAVSNGRWNSGMGNHISILHSNGVVTYYGHLMKLFVNSGDQVGIGQEIGLVGGQPGMPGAGDSTGCHVHWDIKFARNPLTGRPVGAEFLNGNLVK